MLISIMSAKISLTHCSLPHKPCCSPWKMLGWPKPCLMIDKITLLIANDTFGEGRWCFLLFVFLRMEVVLVVQWATTTRTILYLVKPSCLSPLLPPVTITTSGPLCSLRSMRDWYLCRTLEAKGLVHWTTTALLHLNSILFHADNVD